MAELAARLNAVDGRVAILAPAILTRMLDMSDLQSLFVVGDPPTTNPAANTNSDSAINRAPRSSRPRASSLHRLSTGG